jgi:hypothetical protein
MMPLSVSSVGGVSIVSVCATNWSTDAATEITPRAFAGVPVM